MLKKKNMWFLVMLFLISFLRMVIAVNTNYAIISGKFDDELAIHLGYSLISGKWLGTYSYTTLIKGITYPCFVAIVKLIGLTYAQGICLLMIAASLIFIQMFSHFNSNKIFLILTYIFILFNPAGFLGWTALHIYRDSLTIWLLFIFFSCMIVLFEKRRVAWRKSWKWLLGFLISFVLLYYLREDSIWLFPFVLIMLIICAFQHWSCDQCHSLVIRVFKSILFTSLPFLSVFLVGIVISTLNYNHYGIFCVNDRVSGPFADMMELIYKVEDDNTDEQVWISKNMLWKCIEVSPTLMGMEDEIENVFNARVEEDGQVHGDYMQWTLRTAFRDAGYYTDAVETQTMLSRVVEELTEAYDNGSLSADCKLHISKQGRGMTLREAMNYIPRALYNCYEVSDYEGCYNFYPYYPQMDEELKGKFESMLSIPLSEQTINSVIYVNMNKICVLIYKIYHRVGDNMLFLSLLISIFILIYEFSRFVCGKGMSENIELAIPLIGILLSGFLLIYMITIFTTFLTKYNFYNYITGIYCIYSIFEILIISYLWKTTSNFLKSKLSTH